MKSVCCVVICFSLVGHVAGKLPSYIHVCKMNDPDYDACVVRSIEELKPRLATGISKLRIPALEPFSLPGIEVNRDLEQVSLRLSLRNVKAHDASQFEIESFKTNLIGTGLIGPTMAITVVLPSLLLEAQYDIDGRILTATLKGKGNIKANFTNVRSETTVLGKVETINGVRRLSIALLTTNIRMEKSDFRLVNRPEQPINAAATNVINDFIKQNRNEVLLVLYPIIDETLREILVETLGPILKRLDYDELFPAH